MIDTLLIKTGSGVRYVRSHPQLLITIILIIVIPIAFLVSGQQFLGAARENQERLEKERVGMMHDMFASLLITASFAPEVIQKQIEDISALNPDVTIFEVVKEEHDGIKIIASLDREQIGAYIENRSAYRIANTNPNESLISPYARKGIRYWHSYRLVTPDSGEDYYIFTETSLQHIDKLFASRIMTAYYWLIGLLIIIFILLVRHVRLIDYGYLYRETKKANEAKDLFSNMIAHELRAPLTAIRGYASIIQENKSADQHTHYQAKNIERSSERLLMLINDMLDVARIQSGRLSIKNANIPVSDVVLAVIDEMKSIAQEKQIILNAEGVHREIIIFGDERRLHQALTNLVSNAIKYTEKGEIDISLETFRDRVEIRVKDTGMGISSENQKKLFAPFFRVETKTVDAITGTGLGMWITKQLIELMGGSIGIESIKGIGTHVVITLPIKR